jgi:hypothetical protein
MKLTNQSESKIKVSTTPANLPKKWAYLDCSSDKRPKIQTKSMKI